MQKLQKFEPYFFYLLLVVFSLPVLVSDYFLTVDGPAHIYNSRLIAELVSNSSSPIYDFLQFNDSLTPNWTGHFILSLFQWMGFTSLAEKVVLLSYVIGLPVAMRYAFGCFGLSGKVALYLVFPFCYSYLFYYGFFNFNMGVVLLFFGLGFWKKNEDNVNGKTIAQMTILASLIALSHMFVFLLFGLGVALLFGQNWIRLSRENGENQHQIGQRFLYELVCFAPGIILLLVFVGMSDGGSNTVDYIPFQDLIISLKYLMPIKGVQYEAYGLVSKGMLYVLVLLIFYNLFEWTRKISRTKKVSVKINYWLLLTLISLFLLFLVPNQIGAAGFLSARFLLFVFLFLLLGLAKLAWNKWISLFVFLFSIGVNGWVVSHTFEAQKENHTLLTEIEAASAFVEQNATVMPITFSDHFLHKHVSNYLGVKKPMVLLENYEAGVDQFPLSWNLERMPKLTFGGETHDPELIWPRSTGLNPVQAIDFLLVIQDSKQLAKKEEWIRQQTILHKEYTLVYSSPSGAIDLYRLK